MRGSTTAPALSIAARQFQRSFVLADGMEVRSAELANGLLRNNFV